MSLIPKSHPRAKSLYIRERLVEGFDSGLVAKEGLMAHGRGETFDYLLGEKTSKHAQKAICAAAFALDSADYPVSSSGWMRWSGSVSRETRSATVESRTPVEFRSTAVAKIPRYPTFS